MAINLNQVFYSFHLNWIQETILWIFQSHVPSLKALAEALYQSGEFEKALIQYEKERNLKTFLHL